MKNLEGEDVIVISYEDVQNWICFSSLGLIITLAAWLCEEQSWPLEMSPWTSPDFQSLYPQGLTMGLDFSFTG